MCFKIHSRRHQPIEDGIKATETTVNNTFGRFKI